MIVFGYFHCLPYGEHIINEVSQELAEYKSVRNRMYVTELEQENDWLRGKLEKYDAMIEKNNLRRFFERQKKKTLDRENR